MGLLLSLSALFGICFGLKKYCNLPAGAAPLAGLSCVYLLLFFGGVGGVLPLAAWAMVLAGWILLLVLLYQSCKAKSTAELGSLFTPGGLVFWGGAILLLLRLVWLQPSFLNFDEYSFWGAAMQLTCENGVLYPACETGRPWVMTELPGIPLVGYFFQLAGGFAPWKAIYAVDVLMLAALAAAVSCCERKSPRLWGPAAAAVVLIPTALTVPGRTGAVSTTWLEILGDLPAGILFGGAVAFWLAVREQEGHAKWLVFPVLCLTASVKSNTLPMALAAAGIILLDWLLLPPKDAAKGLRPVLGRAGFGLLGLIVPVVQYGIWTKYVTPFVLQNATTGGMGDTANASLPAVAINGIKMLLGGTGDAFFEQRRADLYAYADVMRQAFTQRDISIFGSGMAVCVVVAMVFAMALWVAPNTRQRLRVILTALGSTVCFAGYWLMLLLSYAFIFKDSSPSLAGLASYARYMNSYYAGWLLLAVAVLAHQASGGKKLSGMVAGLLTAVVLAVATATAWEPQFTILGASRNVYSENAARTAQAQQVKAQLSEEDRVFLIQQGDDGFYWFWYAQALLPNIVEYGAGGGTYGAPVYEQAQPYYQSYTAAEMQQLIAESGANCILVAQSDEVFVKSYAALFTDELAAAEHGMALYRIEPEGYVPVWSAQANREGVPA